VAKQRPSETGGEANPDKLSIYDFDHIDFVAACLELEAEIGVAYTLQANRMR
jgi:hypothetical protein